MKTKLTIVMALGIITLAFVFKSPESSNISNTVSGPIASHFPVAAGNISDKFLIGTMDNGAEIDYNTLTGDLRFNLWHKYINGGLDGNGQFQIYGWNYTTDLLTSPIGVYKTDVQNIITGNSNHSMRTLMERPKTTRLAFGQRSDYQCEDLQHVEEGLWFYSFRSAHHTGSDVEDTDPLYGSNSWVRRCLVNQNQTDGGAGWVVSGLRANREQVNSNARWEGDRSYSWIVKPKIRADRDYVINHFDEEICRIDVVNYEGDLIKSTILRARHFQDGNGDYDGKYKEEAFNFDIPRGDSTLTFDQPKAINFNPAGKNYYAPDGECKVDYRVYWYGNCNMWIDYVRVDNGIADELFKGQHDDWLQWEAEDIARHTGSPLKFYIEEFEFNNIPCMAYVSRKLRQYNPAIGLMCDLNYTAYNTVVPFQDWYHVFDNYLGVEHIKRYLIDSVGSTEIFMGSYPFGGSPPGSDSYAISKIPQTLSALPYNEETGMLRQTTSVQDYDNWLQLHLDDTYHQFWSYRNWTARADSLSKIADIPFINLLQTHLWKDGGYRLAEPTNEETDLMTNLAVSWGARGVLHFMYTGWGCLPSNGDNYGRGLTNPNPCNNPNPFDVVLQSPAQTTYSPRLTNVYDQPKWQKIVDIDKRLEKWGPTLMGFDNANRHSFIYRLERDDMKLYTYIHDIYTYKRSSDPFPCTEDFPEEISIPSGYIGECKEQRYLQAATFENPNERNTNYFMLVNRRCSPFINDNTTEDNNGGRRLVQIQFDPNAPELANYNGWTITDLATNTQIRFNKVGMPVVDLDFFMPGEGRLYKMTPTIRTGGPLAGDEVITGESFTCEDTIFSNGYNITIGAGTNMKFTDSSCIVMNGGVFTMGDQQVSGSQNITFDAASGSSWRGHSFTGTEVHIYGASFSGLANDSVYALNLIDCPVVDIRNTTFNTAGTLKGGINAVYYSNEESATVNFYTGGNTFTATGSTIPTINVSSFAGMTTPLIIENNTFTNGNTAVFLSGITGGAVKNNNISENYTGISLLSSYIDVSGNTISSTVNGSTGIFAAGGSEVKMNSAGSKELGGMNNISNEGTGTNNVKVEGSYFLTDEGQNVFNISDITTSNHLYGYFPMYISIPVEETMNCFKISGSPTHTPYNLVTDGYQGTQITFNFNPLLTGCNPEQGENMMVLDLGNGINDTIYSNGSGSGGSVSSINNEQLSISNKNQKQVYVPNVNTAYDSICMLMRSRNYSAAKTKCLEMITNYPDSIQSLNALAKLYLASVSSNANVTDLKVFYENLILNHPNNTSLVKRANYYILKCKVRLHEYTSALAGFQQIINENPYSYEGLIARWDYMATSLLVPGSGGEPMNADFGFSIADLKAEDLEAEDREGNSQSQVRNPNSSDDKSPFTKEQRINIRKSINTAIESDKNDNDRKIRVLETKSDQGDLNAIKELAQVKALKQVVKTEKPRSITEHIKLVSEDIQKVFGSVTGGKGKDLSNIPTVYRLSQNYPNPFNPVTKINYDLPKDAKVSIVIYDILGREVKRLVNNEQKTAGTYIIDFNAANYASGVYFYRIEAEELGGNKFVDSKKMVLLK